MPLQEVGVQPGPGVPILRLHLCPVAWDHQFVPGPGRTRPCPLPPPWGHFSSAPVAKRGQQLGVGRCQGFMAQRELGGLWPCDPHPRHRPVTRVGSALWLPGARCQEPGTVPYISTLLSACCSHRSDKRAPGQKCLSLPTSTGQQGRQRWKAHGKG